MKLTYFRGDAPNFGDELNATMWSCLLPPGILDEDEGELFLGIGSILSDSVPKGPRKVVAGSGWGYCAPPNVHDGSWEVLWVRGPRTAAALGIDRSLAITDAAVLMCRTQLPVARNGVGAAFMPHVDSLARGEWEAVCQLAGVTFLDPRAPPQDLLALIRGARVVIAEAMHGAILADALRTPWVAVTPIHPMHRPKWLDWSESLGVDLRPMRLWPSNSREGYTLATKRDGRGRRIRALLDGALMRPVNAGIRHLAAKRLLQVTERVEPQLSRDDAVEDATQRCEEALSGFVRRRGRRIDCVRHYHAAPQRHGHARASTTGF